MLGKMTFTFFIAHFGGSGFEDLVETKSDDVLTVDRFIVTELTFKWQNIYRYFLTYYIHLAYNFTFTFYVVLHFDRY